MSFTLDVSKTVLLSLHMQHDIVFKNGKFGDFFGEQAETRNVVVKARNLLNEARTHNVCVIHAAVCFKEGHSDLHANSPLLSMVQQTDALVKGTWGADFISDVHPQEKEVVIESQRVGPFEGTDLAARIQDTGADTVILFGVATDIVVSSATRVLSDMGYNVVIAEDCCSAGSQEAHEAALATLGLLAHVSNSEDITEKLQAASGIQPHP
ncbi:cysteine hydrolase [Evansella sp. LMS18]|jgi:nicotinamidase-related amidase|uniref:cysteine hydrolase family protein n=1 Tax=Evansella sp. LMS18 TaxID=2924033 RepID=UPI0020D1DDDA|nr:isochorismatase family cysteine hydrolase [Evansella sp. LMS18]UTR09875.1 cysteine hydrolase [Evansella sp. LMS18]